MLRPALPLILAALLAPAVASGAGLVAKPSLATQQDPATLVLDASRAADGIMEVRERIPAIAGSFTIVYPKWIPGEHGPTGPLNDLAALRISADGVPLDWRRDPNDLYAFHVDVPAGTQALDAEFDVLMNASGDVMSSHSLAIVNWNRALLYQDGIDSHRYFVKPSILLPAGWDFATALRGATQSGNRVDFAVTPLNMLVDSPLDHGALRAEVGSVARGLRLRPTRRIRRSPSGPRYSRKPAATRTSACPMRPWLCTARAISPIITRC